MSIVLYPGDKIHLAFGIDSNLTAAARREQAHREHDEFARTYARHGVEVVSSSANSLLTHPVVVAVFRGREKPKEAAAARWVFESFDELVEARPRPSRGQSAQVGDVTYLAIDDRWCAL